MKNIISKISVFVMVLTLLCGIPVMAGEDSVTISKMVTANVDLEAKAEPKEGAETLFSYKAGDKILVVEEINSQWYSVAYQGEIGYVKQADTGELVQEEAIDVGALDKELDEHVVEGKIMVEEVERFREEARQTRIWGTIIVVLVAAILGAGIYSQIKAKK